MPQTIPYKTLSKETKQSVFIFYNNRHQELSHTQAERMTGREFGIDYRTVHSIVERAREKERNKSRDKLILNAKKSKGVNYHELVDIAMGLFSDGLHGEKELTRTQIRFVERILDRVEAENKKETKTDKTAEKAFE